MSQSAKTVFVFGVYLLALGLVLLLVPNLLLTALGFPGASEVWIRLVGMLVLFVGYYYVQTARMELGPFFAFTVHTRVVAALCVVVFVLTGVARPRLLVFAIADAFGALWTSAALRTGHHY